MTEPKKPRHESDTRKVIEDLEAKLDCYSMADTIQVGIIWDEGDDPADALCREAVEKMVFHPADLIQAAIIATIEGHIARLRAELDEEPMQ